MNGFVERFQEVLGRLSSKQKFQLVLALVTTLGLIWGLTAYANRVRYGVLFSNVDRSDAAPIITSLKEKQIPYRLAAGGTMIEVPVERIDELRLELAGEGLPPGGGVGFELFDKPAFGLSDFVQNVNYRRALERELGRTIQSLQVVTSARVHLALPPETVFAEDRREPSASVVVGLRSGRAISLDRVRAISNLVASGVEGLEPHNVSVIDGEGRLLSTGDEDDRRLSATQLEAKASMERDIEATLISILEPLVGGGRVRARATVDLNMTRVERIEESYDPTSAVVRSEEKTKQKSEGTGGTGGIPGTASNVPGGQPGAAGSSSGRHDAQTTVTNFEINKTVATISEPVGTLARQSIAVVVDHAPATPADGSTDSPVPTPRSAEEMQKITELVRAAVGYDADRGDQVIVENVPFEAAPAVTDAGGFDLVGLLLRIGRYASLPLAVLLLALLVIRPAIATLRGLKPAAETGTAGGLGGLPPTVAQLQAEVQAQLGGAGEAPAIDGSSPLRRKLMEAVSEDPQTAALVVRSWLDRRQNKG